MGIRTRRRLAVPLVSALAVSALALAKEANLFEELPVFGGTVEVLQFPPGRISAGDPLRSFGRTLVADLTDLPGPDLVTSLDGELVLVADPGRFQSFAPTGIPAHDFDVLRHGGSGGRDAILHADDAGTWLSEYDPESRQWSTTPFDETWKSCRAVRGEGSHRICLSADGSLLQAEWDGRSITIPLDVEGKSLELLDFDGDGELEVLLLHTVGVRVIEVESGSVSFDLSDAGWPHDRDQIAVVRAGDDPSGHDLLVYVADPLADGSQWACIAEYGIGFTDFVDLGFLDVARIVSAPLDDGGFPDLLVTCRYDHGVLAVLNQRSAANPTGTRFDGDWAHLRLYFADATTSAEQNQVGALAADFDQDGDPELLYLLAGEDRYTMFEDLATPSLDLAPAVSGSVEWNAALGSLDFGIDLSALGQDGTLLVDVYRAAGAGALLDPEPLVRTSFPVSQAWADASVVIPETLFPEFSQVYSFVLQYRDPAGTLSHEWFGIWASTDAVAEQLHSGEGPSHTVQWNDGGGEGEDDPTEGGAFVPGRRGGSTGS